MTASPAYHFAFWMAKHGLGVWDGQGDGNPIVSPLLPDRPLPVTAVAASAPIKDGREMRSGGAVIHPVISILVRDPAHENAWELAQRIKDAALDVRGELLGVPDEDTVIAACSLQSGPFDLGAEAASGAFIVSLSISFTYG